MNQIQILWTAYLTSYKKVSCCVKIWRLCRSLEETYVPTNYHLMMSMQLIILNLSLWQNCRHEVVHLVINKALVHCDIEGSNVCQEITHHHAITVHYITHYTIMPLNVGLVGPITPHSGFTLNIIQHEYTHTEICWCGWRRFPHSSVIQVCRSGAHHSLMLLF